jgi:LasA protease
MKSSRGALPLALLVLASLACQFLSGGAGPGLPGIPSVTPPPTLTPAVAGEGGVAATVFAPVEIVTALPPTLTPEPASVTTPLPTPEGGGNYQTQNGDTLETLALRFRTTVAAIEARNPGLAPAGLGPRQTLPPGTALDLPHEGIPNTRFASRLLPDSEVVFSPAAAGFDVRGFVLSQPGFLASYSEVLTQTQPALPGWEIVALYARKYSINPRLLLALLEYQSGALSNPAPDDFLRRHPLGVQSAAMDPGLSHQLGWVSNQLNYGYYGWRLGTVLSFNIAEGPVRYGDGNLNAGSFALARVLGLMHRSDAFGRAAGADGVMATYQRLFGSAFSLAYEPLIPGRLTQPELQLPFEAGKPWAFTGGPHSSYGSTLPWGALDFGPPAEVAGCAQSPEWVTAAAAGTVVYSHDGLLELDAGGGWTLVYLHLETRDRAPVGAVVARGERLGHPSCEGGRATGSHVHLSRRYNGEWLAADGFAPFVMSGWVAAAGTGSYLGTLTRGEQVIEACSCAKATTRLWLEP